MHFSLILMATVDQSDKIYMDANVSVVNQPCQQRADFCV